MFNGPVGPVGLFLLARSCFGEFLQAYGQRFTVSVEPSRQFLKSLSTLQYHLLLEAYAGPIIISLMNAMQA